MKGSRKSTIRTRSSKYRIGMRIIVFALLIFIIFFSFWIEVRAQEPEITLYSTGRSEVSYCVYQDGFRYNRPAAVEQEKFPVTEGHAELTHYEQLTPVDSASGAGGEEPYPSGCYGLLYCGTIPGSVPGEDGTLTETVLSPAEGRDCVFSARYPGAVIDGRNKSYDLLLRFTRIAFRADTELTGPVRLMNNYRLHVSTDLCEDGKYLLQSDGGEAFHLCVRYEFDYSIEDQDGRPAEGTMLFDVSGSGAEGAAGLRKLISPSGSMEIELHAAGRSSEDLRLFTPEHTHYILQDISGEGSSAAILREAGDTAADAAGGTAGKTTEYTDPRLFLREGDRIDYILRPDPGAELSSLRIDEQDTRYPELVWTKQSSGEETAELTVLDHYGKSSSAQSYLLTRYADGSLGLSFENIRDDHKIKADFAGKLKAGISLPDITGRNRRLRKLCAAAMLLSGMVFLGTALFLAAAEQWDRRQEQTGAKAPQEESKQ